MLKEGAQNIRRLVADGNPAKATEEAKRLLSQTALPDPASVATELKDDPWQAVELSLLLRFAGRPEEALTLTEMALAAHPNASEVLMEQAEALYAINSPQTLGDAMTIFKRLRTGVTRGSPAWWTCELRQLQILERMGANTDQIEPRIERLRLFNPDLGGPSTQRAFDALQASSARRRLQDSTQ